MKKLYLIATSSALTQPDITAYLETCPEYHGWFYSMPNSIFVHSELRADEIYERLKKHFSGDNRFFVTEVPLDNAQGWIPQKHWDIIKQQSIVHDYVLDFKGYWREENKRFLPAAAGIYCVYASGHNPINNTVSLNRLLYIGQSEDVRSRHINGHENLGEWKSNLDIQEEICYAFAPLAKRSLIICEAALINRHRPVCNRVGIESFFHDATRVRTKGCNAWLENDFIVNKTIRGF